jgi:hypothetical protein
MTEGSHRVGLTGWSDSRASSSTASSITPSIGGTTAPSSLKIRHDESLVPDLEIAVGSGNVRLLGQRGTTTRVGSLASRTGPARPMAAVKVVEADDDAIDDIDADDD